MIKCQTQNIDKILKQAEKYLEGNEHDFLKDVAQLAAKNFREMATLPLGASQKGKGKLKAGEGTISKELNRAVGSKTKIYELAPQKNKKQIYYLIKNNKSDVANKIAHKNGVNLRIVNFNPTLHKMQRVNGHVDKDSRLITNDEKQRDNYRKNYLNKQVGKLKSGWLLPGQKAQKWISRHGANCKMIDGETYIIISNPMSYAKENMIGSLIQPSIKKAYKGAISKFKNRNK